MKTIYTKAIALVITLLGCLTVSAHDFEVNGVYYNIVSNSDRTAAVTFQGSESGHSGYEGVVTIPETVEFHGTKYTVTTIGLNAFSVCRGLKSVIMPNTITNISSNAFLKCSGLTTVTIPYSVVTIGSDAFADCFNIDSIAVDVRNRYYESRGGCNAIIRKSDNTLVLGCKRTVIPAHVKTIGYGAFHGALNVRTITIPNNVEVIDNFAFDGCSILESIYIPASIKKIGLKAFGRCSRLGTITVDAANAVYDSRNNCNAIIEKATGTLIVGCKNTIIPDGITAIGERAFEGHSHLSAIDIPASVQAIGHDGFYDCFDLKEITLHNATPVKIDNFTFSGVPTSAVVHVPAGAVETYKANRKWNTFFPNIIAIGEKFVEKKPEPVVTEEEEEVVDATTSASAKKSTPAKKKTVRKTTKK